MFAALRRRLAELLGDGRDDVTAVRLVADVASGAVTPHAVRVLVLTIRSTGQPQRVTENETLCRWALVISGPKDAATSNAAKTLLGTDNSVTPGTGLYIAVDGSLALPGMDLSQLYVAGTAADVVRILYAA